MIRSIAAALAALLLATAAPTGAPGVEPGERLDDPALEARARDISQELRCLVCQNQSIDDSNADLARDLRVLVRERLVAGDTDEEVVDFVVARYGEFVLLRPPVRPGTWLLWFGPPALLVVGGTALAVFALRRRRAAEAAPAPLTAQEKARLAELLEQERS